MSEGAAEAPVPTGEASAPVADSNSAAPVAEGSGQQQEIKTNPAWQPILDVLPTSLHGIVSPTLKDWDRGVQERFREIHSQYEPLKAYEGFAKAGVPVEDIASALGLLQAINDDPRGVWESMGNHYQFMAEQAAAAQEQQNSDDPFSDSYVDPSEERIATLEKTLQSLVQTLTQEREQSTQQEQSRAMEEALSELKTKYGEYDREFVLTQMAAGLDAEDAVKSYMALVDRIKSDVNRPTAPVVVGGGSGGVVAPQDSKNLTPAQRRDRVAQMLRSAKES